MKTALKLVAALCALAGVASGAYGGLRFQQETRFAATAEHAVGVATEIQTRPIDEERNRYCAVVSFADANKKDQSFVDADCDEEVHKGDHVPVLYGGNLPARIDRGETPLQAALPFGGGAAGIWVLAILAVFVQGKLKER